MLQALCRALESRDPGTHRHAQRVERYALALSREYGITDQALLDAIRSAALLHDIGKLAIPDDLLHKPASLSASEYDSVKQHAVIGADLLAAVPGTGPLALIVRHHHENWDGTGYPDRLRAESIPLGSRVLAVVDCFDALHSPRPYREPLAPEVAVAMIRERRGTMFDPQIVDVFLRIMAPVLAVTDATRPQPRGRVLCLREVRTG
jgi:putative nucleotidyltransferase with HDIG domain